VELPLYDDRNGEESAVTGVAAEVDEATFG
jgi:hypothetical protein